ncbi:uncharacterized protein SOCG_04631 [Schizosaccharomyces octosporus yFS286]|uniref:Uncharacterized protein n=1 Tax=Schizosaccharomyces octosporus (strain yFS286) TaxID=483514 RepID=S9RN37_SCHOY|nr:uncharacterized protein SOCG_04631 [Schizosaccharomyces octosporus yFS286]EPX75389.1 hypothetical protein SOCG_04631 [Schizosaccharomyces octosporus yFS286]
MVDPNLDEKEKEEASAGTDSTYGYHSNSTEGYSDKPDPEGVDNQSRPTEESKTAEHLKGDVEEVIGKATKNKNILEKGKTMKEQ